MDDSFRLIWSLESSQKIESIKSDLVDTWGEKTALKFLHNIKVFENLVTHYPQLYPASLIKPDLRKAVIIKHHSIIYKIDNDIIRIITIIYNRQKMKF